MAAAACIWRADIDSLAFHPERHQGLCVVHRRAFRALLGIDPTPGDCRDYFETRKFIFLEAAAQKIRRANISSTANLHLNSRDIRRTAQILLR